MPNSRVNSEKLIFLIEEDPGEVLEFEKALLESRVQHPVRVLSSLAEALPYLEGRGTFSNREIFPIPSMILLNLDMPEERPAQFIAAIRQAPELQSILLIGTTNACILETRRLYDPGLNAIFRKQVDLSKTIALIRELEVVDEIMQIHSSFRLN